MKEKFTSGEWIVYQGEIKWCQNKVCIIEHDGHTTVITEVNLYFDKDERTANAHLIATAPKMYAMLDRLHEHLDNDDTDGLAFDIRELLAEARGEL